MKRNYRRSAAEDRTEAGAPCWQACTRLQVLPRRAVRTWPVRPLDRRLLQMPAARAFRFRYVAARREIASFLIEGAAATATRLRCLASSCDIPRELAGAASDVRARLGSLPPHITFYGLDLDATVLDKARRFMSGQRYPDVHGTVGGRGSIARHIPEPSYWTTIELHLNGGAPATRKLVAAALLKAARYGRYRSGS